MKRLSRWLAFVLGLCLVILPSLLVNQGAWSRLNTRNLSEGLPALWPSQVAAETTKPATPKKPPDSKKPDGEASDEDEDGETASDLKPFKKIIKGAKKLPGLFTLYQNPKTGRLFAEINPNQLNHAYLCTITLESGIGQDWLYSGIPLSDFLFYFRRVGDELQFVVQNVNFRTQGGALARRLLDRSFSDSVLYSLPIRSIHEKTKSLLIDLKPLFLSDLPGLKSLISAAFEGSYSADSDQAYFGPAKAFPRNVELESVLNFSGANDNVPALADPRGFTLRVHYSLSQLPENNSYKPRLADSRIGYFVTAYKDFTRDDGTDPERFVRYINRWHLAKKDPNASLAPPKQPIVFWIENTVPKEYRQAIREGVLMWNSAFEKVGFQNALEVKQMPDDAKWDPEDVRYNTIRWFQSFDAVFAIGPSRVNPLTGQILDADILISADFVKSAQQRYRVLADLDRRSLAAGDFLNELFKQQQFCQSKLLRLPAQYHQLNRQPLLPRFLQEQDFCYGSLAAEQVANGALSLSFQQNVLPSGDEMKQFLHEFLRELTAHEVGHTLGLRHNFHGSTMLMPQDLHNTEITHSRGLVASVMDYNPPNIAASKAEQGDYYTAKVGPYDDWAIAYGYQPIDALVPQAERRALDEIAQRSAEPDLAYGTDEDALDGLDPDINRFDLSGDNLGYAQSKLEQAKTLWKRIEQRYPVSGQSYTELRDMFDTIFSSYYSQVFDIVPSVGGQSLHRDYESNVNSKLPFELVPLQRQRQALDLLQAYVFDEEAFQFSPTLLNKLAPSRWNHWGSDAFSAGQLDYPLHGTVLRLQTLVLSDLLSSDRLTRLLDNSLKSEPNSTLTLAELFDRLQTGIWTELVPPEGQPVKISSLRRGLQRQHLNLMVNLLLKNANTFENARTLLELIVALRTASVPEDARTLAGYFLRQLQEQLNGAIASGGEGMDIPTRAHLQDSRDRIVKALNAPLIAQ